MCVCFYSALFWCCFYLVSFLSFDQPNIFPHLWHILNRNIRNSFILQLQFTNLFCLPGIPVWNCHLHSGYDALSPPAQFWPPAAETAVPVLHLPQHSCLRQAALPCCSCSWLGHLLKPGSPLPLPLARVVVMVTSAAAGMVVAAAVVVDMVVAVVGAEVPATETGVAHYLLQHEILMTPHGAYKIDNKRILWLAIDFWSQHWIRKSTACQPSSSGKG